MFSKAHLGLVWWPATLTEYDEDGNEHERKVMFQFRPLTRSEFDQREREALKKMREAVAEAMAPREAGNALQAGDATLAALLANLEEKTRATDADVDTLLQRTLDWRVKTPDGTTVPFDRGFLAELLQHPQYYVPISTAFAECCKGAIRKNSSPGPAGVVGQVQA